MAFRNLSSSETGSDQFKNEETLFYSVGLFHDIAKTSAATWLSCVIINSSVRCEMYLCM